MRQLGNLGGSGYLDHGCLVHSALSISSSESKPSSTPNLNILRDLAPIREQSSSPLKPAAQTAMETMDKSFPAILSGRPPTTGSWNDLINQNRHPRDGLGQSSVSETAARSRTRSSGANPASRRRSESLNHRRPQSSAASLAQGPKKAPVHASPMPNMRPHTTSHHPEQRTSPVSAAQTRPSPLRTMRSTDSLPEMGSNTDIFADNDNNYSIARNQPGQEAQKAPVKRPTMYARPQRLSNGAKAAEAGYAPRPGGFQFFDSVVGAEGRMRGMDRGNIADGRPLVESFPQPSLAGWQRRPEMLARPRLVRPGPNELFERLPGEVLRLILDHLRRLHLEKKTSCATCWMRDCCSVAMGNKKWLHAARAALYEDIQLVGPDSAQQRKKYKGVYATRLVLLRRSVRADPELAEMVRSIKVPGFPDDMPLEAEEYHDIVASVVMACPNLESLNGFYPSYTHSESRLFNALTTRKKLKEMTWVLDATPIDADHQGHKSRPSSSKGRPSGADAFKLHSNPYNYLTAQLANKFVRHHMNWNDLSHLTIHCLPGANLRTPNSLISVALTYLTSLRSLYLSQVPSGSFNDNGLLHLPSRLQKLSISHCSGVTGAGLSTFATHSSAQNLQTLTLIHQNLDSLPAIVRILSNLSKLTTFNLVQAAAPVMPDDTFTIWLMPYLASQSLRNLHWDISESGSELGGATKADDILARSISAGGFPSLRMLRTPCDPDGLFQELCKPRERIDLLEDRYGRNNGGWAQQAVPLSRANGVGGAGTKGGHKPITSSGHSRSGSSVEAVASSDLSSDGRSSWDTSSKDSGKFLLANQAPTREAGSDLHAARRAAQLRLEAARKWPRIEANVTDEDGILIESSGLAGYMGLVTSKIRYELEPDAGGSDERGGLVGIAELLGDGGEDLDASPGGRDANGGAGYGTGCVAACVLQARDLEEKTREAAAEGKGHKANRSNGGSGKSGKDKDKGPEGKEGEDAKTRARDGCTGRWNSYNSETRTPDKKEAGPGTRWWHTERGRWKGRVELS